jgi:hypothetical protein
MWYLILLTLFVILLFIYCMFWQQPTLPGHYLPVEQVITKTVNILSPPTVRGRVILNGQTDARENGIWVATDKWRRAADLNREQHVVVGASVVTWPQKDCWILQTVTCLQTPATKMQFRKAILFIPLLELLLPPTEEGILTCNKEGKVQWTHPPLQRVRYEQTWSLESMSLFTIPLDCHWYTTDLQHWVLYIIHECVHKLEFLGHVGDKRLQLLDNQAGCTKLDVEVLNANWRSQESHEIQLSLVGFGDMHVRLLQV